MILTLYFGENEAILLVCKDGFQIVNRYPSGTLRMNARETEENFCAIIIAIQNGNITIARRVFDVCLNNAVNDRFDRAINLLRKNGYITLSRELDRLKNEAS